MPEPVPCRAAFLGVPPAQVRSLPRQLQRFGRGTTRYQRLAVSCSRSQPNPVDQPRQKDNPITVGLVTVLTEGLRLLGVGKDQYQKIATTPSVNKPLKKGDIDGVCKRIAQDFKQAYIVTGIIDDSIYEPDCFFADPTVAFSGVQLWKRNLQLLVPFLVQPEVEMLSIKKLGKDAYGAQVLKTRWRLSTYLSLPWNPLIDIIGETEYTLNADANRVTKHIESWNVSGTEALLQMFRPTKGPARKD